MTRQTYLSNHPELDPMRFMPQTHNGIITIIHTPTGARACLRLWREKMALGGVEVVRRTLVCGYPGKWQRFGHFGLDGVLRLWKHGLTPQHERLAHMLLGARMGNAIDLEFLFEGRCRCCNRLLTVPESILLGIGPVCLAQNGLSEEVARLRPLSDDALYGEFRSARALGHHERAWLAMALIGRPELRRLAREQLGVGW